jgi:hypothetical protein
MGHGPVKSAADTQWEIRSGVTDRAARSGD